MILDVRNLTVEFPLRRGRLVAVDGISFSIAPGEVLGVVGESGAGKSLTGMAVIGLLEPPGRIAAGEVRLEGRRIDKLPYAELRRIRGRRIGVVFQDPLTSLNPLYTVGQQLEETILTHLPMNRAEARRRALQLLGEVGIPGAEARLDHYPHQFSGGSRSMRFPSSHTSPAAMRPGGSSRPMIDSPVSDLPAPDSPTTPRTSPASIWNDTSSTATSRPRRVGNSTRRLRTSSSGRLARVAGAFIAVSG